MFVRDRVSVRLMHDGRPTDSGSGDSKELRRCS
jgi:hypothetical protein